ncbi:beta-ketoacyl-[acyl-carrier-protein] synthase family protein [Streptomyces sp. SCSIO ZS0520]|uniref:beta-ketoacyl-[acyl-carrier-protein] synthase family protein n=1 Tax=Streptomyces sp. SCSIO ZS0520 TaxID=2892996 RepID=UPI0021D94EF0|nr:beta-ketoacyl-[acyl-carrier-protein] synthase family protein [Streptomyces sp. SCSIO ZS0520]
MTAPGTPFPVAVTGLGMVTAAGLDAARTWRSVTTATAPTGITHPEELRELPCDFFYAAHELDVDAHLGVAARRLMDRVAQLAVIAAREAVADAGLDTASWDGARVAVVIGSAHGGLPFYDRQAAVLAERGARRVSPMVSVLSTLNGPTGSVCRDLDARGPSLSLSTACASGTDAIGTAYQMLRADMCDLALAGGAESALSRLLVASGCQMKAMSTRRENPAAAVRPFDADRDGFVTGEGAGLLVLERPEHAAARGAKARAHLMGYGSTNDAYAPVAPEPDGRGLERALRTALAAAGLSGADLGHINAHGTSTALNDLVESRVLHRVCGEGPLVTSTKAMTGHTLGACGGIETALTVLALQHRLVPPTVNLDAQDPEIPVEVVAKAARAADLECAAKTSLGFGGHNAALVLTRA